MFWYLALTMWGPTCTVVLPTFTALGTLAAAIAAWVSAVKAGKAADATKKATEGQLFWELMNQYDSKETHKAVKSVWNWDRKEVGQDKSKRDEKAKEFVNKKNNEDKKALDFNLKRRRVTHYYMNVLRLKQLGYISKNAAKTIFKDIDVKILDILEPVEKAIIEDDKKDDTQRMNKAIKKLEEDFSEIRNIVNDC
jgi:hypothetical protein